MEGGSEVRANIGQEMHFWENIVPCIAFRKALDDVCAKSKQGGLEGSRYARPGFAANKAAKKNQPAKAPAPIQVTSVTKESTNSSKSRSSPLVTDFKSSSQLSQSGQPIFQTKQDVPPKNAEKGKLGGLGSSLWGIKAQPKAVEHYNTPRAVEQKSALKIVEPNGIPEVVHQLDTPKATPEAVDHTSTPKVDDKDSTLKAVNQNSMLKAVDQTNSTKIPNQTTMPKIAGQTGTPKVAEQNNISKIGPIDNPEPSTVKNKGGLGASCWTGKAQSQVALSANAQKSSHTDLKIKGKQVPSNVVGGQSTGPGLSQAKKQDGPGLSRWTAPARKNGWKRRKDIKSSRTNVKMEPFASKNEAPFSLEAKEAVVQPVEVKTPASGINVVGLANSVHAGGSSQIPSNFMPSTYVKEARVKRFLQEVKSETEPTPAHAKTSSESKSATSGSKSSIDKVPWPHISDVDTKVQSPTSFGLTKISDSSPNSSMEIPHHLLKYMESSPCSQESESTSPKIPSHLLKYMEDAPSFKVAGDVSSTTENISKGFTTSGEAVSTSPSSNTSYGQYVEDKKEAVTCEQKTSSPEKPEQPRGSQETETSQEKGEAPKATPSEKSANRLSASYYVPPHLRSLATQNQKTSKQDQLATASKGEAREIIKGDDRASGSTAPHQKGFVSQESPKACSNVGSQLKGSRAVERLDGYEPPHVQGLQPTSVGLPIMNDVPTAEQNVTRLESITGKESSKILPPHLRVVAKAEADSATLMKQNASQVDVKTAPAIEGNTKSETSSVEIIVGERSKLTKRPIHNSDIKEPCLRGDKSLIVNSLTRNADEAPADNAKEQAVKSNILTLSEAQPTKTGNDTIEAAVQAADSPPNGKEGSMQTPTKIQTFLPDHLRNVFAPIHLNEQQPKKPIAGVVSAKTSKVNDYWSNGKFLTKAQDGAQKKNSPEVEVKDMIERYLNPWQQPKKKSQNQAKVTGLKTLKKDKDGLVILPRKPGMIWKKEMQQELGIRIVLSRPLKELKQELRDEGETFRETDKVYLDPSAFGEQLSVHSSEAALPEKHKTGYNRPEPRVGMWECLAEKPLDGSAGKKVKYVHIRAEGMDRKRDLVPGEDDTTLQGKTVMITTTWHVGRLNRWLDELVENALSYGYKLDINDPGFRDGTVGDTGLADIAVRFPPDVLHPPMDPPNFGQEEWDAAEEEGPAHEEDVYRLVEVEEREDRRLQTVTRAITKRMAEGLQLLQDRKRHREFLKEQKKYEYSPTSKLHVPDSFGRPDERDNPFDPRLYMYMRPARATDFDLIAELYNWWGRHTIHAPHSSPVSQEYFASVFETCKVQNLPFLVACSWNDKIKNRRRKVAGPKVHRERIIGFAFAKRFRDEEVFKHTVEVSVYVDHDCLRLGIGKNLMDRMLPCLDRSYKSHIATEFFLEDQSSANFERGGLNSTRKIIVSVYHVSETAQEKEELLWKKGALAKFGFQPYANFYNVASKHLDPSRIGYGTG